MKHIFTLFLATFLTSSLFGQMNNLKELNKAIGYWQISKEEQHNKKNKCILEPPGADVFLYDGSFVTLFLNPKSPPLWQSEDNYYKMKSKWVNDSLFFLHPKGAWLYLAKFDGTSFLTDNKDENVIWKYKKINKEEIDNDHISILKDRNVILNTRFK